MTTAEQAARRMRLTELTVRIVVPVSIVVVVLAATVASRVRVDVELQLVAPSSARPGKSLALRALGFRGVDRLEGPELAPTPVSVQVVRGAEVVARGTLTPHDRSMEGELTVPEAGQYELVAVAELDGAEVVARAPLRVAEDARGAAPIARDEGALQGLALGVPEVLDAGRAPTRLELRARGGACVPEVPCELLARTDRSVSLTLEPTASASSEPGPSAPPDWHQVVRLVVHGPEAQAPLVARVGDVVVARWDLRIPVSLGVPSVREVHEGPVAVGARPELRVEGLGSRRDPVIDGFVDGLFRHTATVPARTLDAPFSLPFPLDAPGRWRIEVRTELLSSRNAGVRVIDVGPSARSPRDAAWSAARDESFRSAALRTVSSLPAARAKLVKTRERLWFGLPIVALLGGAVLAAVVARRGLRASAEARDILVSAGDEDAASLGARRRATWTVILLAATLGLGVASFALLAMMRLGM